MIVDGPVDFVDCFLCVSVARLSQFSKFAEEVVDDRNPYGNDGRSLRSGLMAANGLENQLPRVRIGLRVGQSVAAR